MAMTAEMTMKTAMKIRMTVIFCASLILFPRSGSMKSSVSVEPEVSTSEDRVDIDADSTRIRTTPIRISGRPESMVGMMLSIPFDCTSCSVVNRCPKPPRK